MRLEALSVFPELFEPYLSTSIMGRARKAGIFEFASYDLRDWTHDRHRTVDDSPFGGGQGMLMKPEPVFEAVRSICKMAPATPYVVFFSPCGKRFDQVVAQQMSNRERILFVCGRYEGMDERVYSLADEVLSMGDYVLTGGELPALCVMDALVRLVPGALGDKNSAWDESFSDGLLEYEQYTRPAEFEGRSVPEVLLSGDHARIAAWRRQNALERTARWRPDLLQDAVLTDAERAYAQSILRSYKGREDSREQRR